MTETTYEDYLASVAAQTQRDRDRFTGIDSHPEAPMYAADTGEAEPSAWVKGMSALRDDLYAAWLEADEDVWAWYKRKASRGLEIG